MASQNLEDIRVFALIVKLGSLSAAAQNVHLTRSAVSKRIMKLEERVGAQLINRSTRSLRLTEAGSRFFEHANQALIALDGAQSAVTSLASAPRGLLKVNAPETFGRICISPCIGAFLATYPDLRVEVSMSSRDLNYYIDDCDVVIRRLRLVDSFLQRELLRTDPFVLCASPDYLSRRGRPRATDQLTEHNCLVHRNPKMRDVWEFGATGAITRIKVSGNLVTNNYELLVDAALQGAGIAYIPLYMVESHFKARSLEWLLPRQSRQGRELWAYYPRSLYKAPKLRAFLDFFQTPPKSGRR
jgi:DNA-binding transcriptional LysR family regulator